jgi:A/G-specific adenine glycosylase
MDLGAVICKPQQPLCTQCPQKKDCLAYKHGWTKLLPVKEKQVSKKIRWLYYFIVQVKDEILVRKRTSKDIWENLYEFVLYESDKPLTTGKKTLPPVCKKLFGKNQLRIKKISEVYYQQLTHQTIVGQFIELEMDKVPAALKSYQRVRKITLKKYPFPRLITSYLLQK